MDLNLKNKTALVTGSSKGIGKSIAQVLHNEGCNIMFNGRHKSNLQSLIKNFKNRSSYVVGDVTKQNVCTKIVKKTISTFGSLDILICNVGSGKSAKPGYETIKDWQDMINVNLMSAIHMVNASLNELISSKGSIVCVSSIPRGASPTNHTPSRHR